MKKATAKSLAKIAVLEASDKPEDQDEARKRRVKMDFASWRKQTKAGKTTHQEEVGISSAAAMEKARREALLRKKEQEAVKKEKEALRKEDYETKKKGEVLKALDKKKFEKKYGKEKAPDIMYAVAAKTAKKKGDTSKSDDRYAYEEVQVDEVYKKLPVAKMASKISKKQFKAGQSGDVKTISKKSTETGKMIGVLDTHDPQRSKAKSKIKEAKVDQGLDDEGKEDARNYRKFGTKHNQHKTAVFRRELHRSRRGEKKVKGEKEVQVERALDTFEKGEKERVVKGMKKDTAGFKNRYGKRWKDVMYATATKKAKEAGDTSKSDKRYAYEANEIGEAKVDTGKTSDQKSTARNLRNTPPGADKDTDLKTFLARKPGESLEKARQRVRQRKHAERRGVKEETIDELNRYEKETGKSSGPAGSYRGGVNTPSKGTPTKKGGSSDKLVHFGKGLKRSAEGRPTGQTRRSYDKRGEEGNTPTPVEKIKKYLDAKRAAKADPSQGRYPPGSRKD